MDVDEQTSGLLKTAARMSVGLLVKGAYDLLETMTSGRHVSARELEQAVASFSHSLVDPPPSEWSRLEVIAVSETGPAAFDVVVPLWTSAGRSGLGLRLHLVETPYKTFDVEIDGIGPVKRKGPAADRQSEAERGGKQANHDSEGRAARSDSLSDDPIPERWRPALAAIVHRLVIGDYAGLAADGLVSYTSNPTDTSIGQWIEEYPATLIDLPPEAWVHSDHGPRIGQPGSWWVIVDLWTAEEGRSDLSMEATVWDDGTDVVMKVDNVHVM